MVLRHSRSKEIILLSLVTVLFITTAVFSHQCIDYIERVINARGIGGMGFYILITVGAVVLTPISTLPLLPIAVTLWGSFLAAILSIVGWMVGSMIAFGLARHYGHPLIKRIRFFSQIEEFERDIPKKYLFWSVFLSRIFLPVDVLSYAIGLFTKMNVYSYSLATILGLSSFAFIISYGINLPTGYLVILGLPALLFIVLGYRRTVKKILYMWGKKNVEEKGD